MLGVSRVLLDLVLPPRCAACARPGAGLCPACLREAHLLRLPSCAPVRLSPSVIALAAFRYDGVIARAIRTVKRPGHHGAAVHLGSLLWTEVSDAVPGVAAWPRTWVPSTRGRLRHRGADIPRLLAGRQARPLLRRVRQQSDQTDLPASQRRSSPVGDFRCGQAVPPCVVLVDDVRTTGGTALAAAEALLQGGCRRIVVVTLAAVDDPWAQ
jgi:predicted amidophosphoribosyltransferase